MTISADYAPNIDIGNGVTTAFAVNFPFGAPGDLAVSLFDTIANADVSPASVLNGGGAHDYTVSGTPNIDTGIYPNGTVTFNSPPPATYKVVRERVTPKRQNAAFTNNGPFPAKTVEGQFDRSEMQNQEAAEAFTRAVVAPASAQTISMEIPSEFFAGGKLLSFDPNAKRLTADDPDVNGMEAAIAEAETVLAEINTALGILGAQAVDFARPSDAYLNAPAGSEPDGYRALVGKAPTGAFAGKRGQIAQKISGTWYFSGGPKAGQRIFDIASAFFWVSRNGWWNKVKPGFTGYQDFADIPDGTAIQGLVIATGQAINAQGAGAAAGTITSGRYNPSSNTYMALDQPSKHVRFGLRGRWKSTVANGNAFALAAGVYSGGAIISKMGAHCSFGYQSAPAVSIWGGPRQTDIGGGPLGYLIEPDLQFEYKSIDSNLTVHGTGIDIVEEILVSGNTIRVWADSGHWANSYTDDMVSALMGDDGSGNGGYIYFQTGENLDANNPYIYEIWWTALDTPQEALPDPKQIPDPFKVPQVAEGDFVFAGGTELFRFTPTNSDYLNMFEVDVSILSNGITKGYSGTVQKWRCGAGKFGGSITAPAPVQLGSDEVVSQNGAVLTLSGALGLTISGNDVIIQYSPTRTGTDASSYQPHVKLILRQLAALTTVSP